MKSLHDRIEQIKLDVLQISDVKIKRDLNKLADNIIYQLDELSKEAVECRRINSLQNTTRATIKFTTLSEEIDRSILRLEKYITFYTLSNV